MPFAEQETLCVMIFVYRDLLYTVDSVQSHSVFRIIQWLVLVLEFDCLRVLIYSTGTFWVTLWSLCELGIASVFFFISVGYIITPIGGTKWLIHKQNTNVTHYKTQSLTEPIRIKSKCLFEMLRRCVDRSAYDINVPQKQFKSKCSLNCGTFMSYADWSAQRSLWVKHWIIHWIQKKPLIHSGTEQVTLLLSELLNESQNTVTWRCDGKCCCFFCCCLELFSFRTEVDDIILSQKCKFLNIKLFFIQL